MVCSAAVTLLVHMFSKNMRPTLTRFTKSQDLSHFLPQRRVAQDFSMHTRSHSLTCPDYLCKSSKGQRRQEKDGHKEVRRGDAQIRELEKSFYFRKDGGMFCIWSSFLTKREQKKDFDQNQFGSEFIILVPRWIQTGLTMLQICCCVYMCVMLQSTCVGTLQTVCLRGSQTQLVGEEPEEPVCGFKSFLRNNVGCEACLGPRRVTSVILARKQWQFIM